jgi:hypothetical protein
MPVFNESYQAMIYGCQLAMYFITSLVNILPYTPFMFLIALIIVLSIFNYILRVKH